MHKLFKHAYFIEIILKVGMQRPGFLVEENKLDQGSSTYKLSFSLIVLSDKTSKISC